LDSATQTPSGRVGALGYMPQLDTLRAVAVLMVIVAHWMGEYRFAHALPLGMVGVTLFFVLSGFLITQILLKEREASDSGHERKWALGRFYIRRTLRIFPVYYLFLVLLYVSGVPEFRGDLLWYVFYSVNVLVYDHQAWVGPASHLWTLAVEEQFYLVWPLLILFTPRQHLWKVIAAAVLLGPISRGVLFYLSNGTETAAEFAHVLTPTCMDCFGLGAILAYRRTFSDKQFRFASWGWRAFLGANVLLLIWRQEFSAMTNILLFRLSISVIAVTLIAAASLGFRGFGRILMECPPLVFLGKISYGLYLFHYPLPAVYRWLGLPVFASKPLALAAQFAFLVLVASASWYCFEKPVKNLARWIPYPERVVAVPPGTPAR